MNKKELSKLSKEELINLVLEAQAENRGCTEDEMERMLEESMQNEAYMERHGHIDYGYGYSCYGPN